MNMTFIILIVVGIGLLGAIGFFIYTRMKGKDKYDFWLINRQGDRIDTLKAKMGKDVVTDENVFYIQKFDKKLTLKPANFFFNGQPIRVITYDKGGELCYADPSKLKEQHYLDINLLPEEKQITINRFRENSRHYLRNMKGWEIAAIVGVVVMMIITIVGVGYSSYNNYKAVSAIAENSEDTKDIANANKAVSDSNKQITEQLTAIAAALTNNKNLTRSLS